MKRKDSPQYTKQESKVIRVPHGLLGRAHTRNISRAINKWGKKGYQLAGQNDQPGGCSGGGYTLLTFVRDI